LRVPAICNNCGLLFPSSFEVGNAFNITFSGCGSGPCPKCGAKGHIPDGVYNFIDNTIQLLSGPSRTVTELEQLAKILKGAKENKSSFEEINNSISEEVPELSSFKDLLPKTRAELYAFISIILTIINILLTQKPESKNNKIEINQVVNVIYQQQAPSGVIPKKPPSYYKEYLNRNAIEKTKIGRNDHCPCGSGKKYKKCCLE